MAHISAIKCLPRQLGLPVDHFYSLKNVKEPCTHFRGTSPSARRSSPLPLEEVASLPQTAEPWTPNGLVGPKDTSLVVILWLCREIETAAIICEDVSGVMYVFVDLRHRCIRDHPAHTVRLEMLIGAVLHLACSEMKCLNVFRLFQRCTACRGRRGGVSGNSTATRRGINQAGRRSAAQVDMPPLSLAQLARPALSALLLLLSCVLRKIFQCRVSA